MTTELEMIANRVVWSVAGVRSLTAKLVGPDLHWALGQYRGGH
jgi:hypothetical protein